MAEEDQILLEVCKRKVVYESLYVEHLHTTVDFMIADEKDEPKILEYLHRHVLEESTIQPESIREALSRKLLILVTDCFDIEGLISGQLVNESTLKPNDSQHELKTLIKEQLPSNFNEFVLVNLLDVRKEYQGAGIELRLWKELLKLAKTEHIQFVVLAVNKIPEEFNLNVTGLSTSTLTPMHLLIANLNELNEYLKEPPPTLPNAYKLPNVERELLTEVYADRLECKIRYEVAVPEDESVIKDFLCNEYFRQTMLTRTLQCRRQDGISLLKRFRTEVLGQGLAILAIVNGRLCGLFINASNVLNENNNRSSSDNDPVFPDDFTKNIDAEPFSHLGGKAVRAVGTWMTEHIGHYLPAGQHKYFYMNMLGVQPHFRGCRIGWTLWMESLKLGHKLGYSYAQTICTAIASNKLAISSGMKPVLTVEYDKIRYKGQKILEDGTVYDGGKEMIMYIGNLDEIFSKQS